MSDELLLCLLHFSLQFHNLSGADAAHGISIADSCSAFSLLGKEESCGNDLRATSRFVEAHSSGDGGIYDGEGFVFIVVTAFCAYDAGNDSRVFGLVGTTITELAPCQRKLYSFSISHPLILQLSGKAKKFRGLQRGVNVVIYMHFSHCPCLVGFHTIT